jgi:dolichol-phosphate mannosyltransferase
MDRRVVTEVVKLSESHGFLRGLVAVVGFKTALLPFDREKRISGDSKYNRYTGSFRIGFDGIIGFSDYLLNLMIKTGFVLAGISILAAFLVAFLKLKLLMNFASGVPSIMILLLFLGGIHLVGLGILGAYISRIYDEVKKRPRYIIDEKYGIDFDL